MIADGKTLSFTPEQQVEVDAVLSKLRSHVAILTMKEGWKLDVLTDYIADRLNFEGNRIKGMDKRPRQVWSDTQPNVFFPYVIQGMLEDLIVDLIGDKADNNLIGQLKDMV